MVTSDWTLFCKLQREEEERREREKEGRQVSGIS